MVWLTAGLLVGILGVWGPKAFELPIKSWFKSYWLVALLLIDFIIIGLTVVLNGNATIALPWLLSLSVLALVDIKYKSVRVVDLWLSTVFCLPLVHWSTVVPTLILTLLVVIVLLGLKFALRKWYGQDALGGADIWLIALILLGLGGASALVAIYIAIILSGLTGLILMLSKGYTRRSYLPFIPFLAFGVLISIFFSDSILTVYFNFITMQ